MTISINNKNRMSPDLITIIIPVYNIRERLNYCLCSIKQQTYPLEYMEIILVDDGSTDGSSALCDQLASAMGNTKVIHQVNQGPGIARNTGLEAANGEYIMFIDGDDYLHVDAIRELYESINSNGGYDLSMCDRRNTENYWESIEFTGEAEVSELMAHDMIMNLFYHEDCVLFYYVWNKLYRRSLIGDLRFGPYTRAEDFDFIFRVLLGAKKIAYVRRPLYFYVRNDSSLSRVQNWEQHYLDTLDILDRNLKDLPMEKEQYRHELLLRLYRCMQRLTTINWNTQKRNKTVDLCRKYEHDARRWYLFDHRFSMSERLMMTIKVRYPHIVAMLRKIRDKIVKYR